MTPEHFQKLAAAGLSVEQIGVVMQILAESEAASKAAEEARKASARERVQRWRDKQKEPVTLPKHNGNATVPLTRGEITPSKEEVSGKEVKEEGAPAARRKGTVLPTDWQPDLAFAVSIGLSIQQAKLEAEKFREWWPAQPGQKAIKADWGLTWKTWCRKALERFGSRGGAPPAETVGSLSRKQLFTPRNDIDAPGYSAGRVDESGPRRLEASAGPARTFAITGDILGRI